MPCNAGRNWVFASQALRQEYKASSRVTRHSGVYDPWAVVLGGNHQHARGGLFATAEVTGGLGSENMCAADAPPAR